MIDTFTKYPISIKSILQLTVGLIVLTNIVSDVVCDNAFYWDPNYVSEDPTRPRNNKEFFYKKPCAVNPTDTNNFIGMPYLPLMNGVYCFNNGTGICKAFSGQFEYYFNTFQDQFLYAAPDSEFVSGGYHKRIPVTYDIDGRILYADRSINWAKSFKANLKGRKISLLSTRDFNWCGYTAKGWWPYKSAIKDYKSNGRYHIYFSNRQSCIYDKESGKPPQHFNTRFLQNSNVRIDLEYNPTIFALEDNLAGDPKIRLVKHKRQHWYEVGYYVVAKPPGRPELNYFVVMDSTQKKPCKVYEDSSVVLTHKAFANVSDLCLDGGPSRRNSGPEESTEAKNNQLFTPWQGLDEMEISDYPWPYHVENRSSFLECDLHMLPRTPEENNGFYGVSMDEGVWRKFAGDGYVFSAMTTIPVEETKTGPNSKKVKVVMLWSDFRGQVTSEYDEYYPVPKLSIYEMTWDNNKWSDPVEGRTSTAVTLKNLNYVDDIAYLHKCKTILIIFGPLYSELPAEKFSIETKGNVDSIDKLGIFEMANAFFAVPESNTLYVYHRTNYIAKYEYNCAASPDGLVTGRRSGNYYYRHGKTQPPLFTNKEYYDFSEETLFMNLRLFKGSRSPEAPDPALYPLGQDAPDEPLEESSNLLLYIIIGIGILLIIAMCVACLITFRRRRRKRRHDEMTRRSSMPSVSGASHAASQRSSFHPSGMMRPVSAGSATSARSSLSNPSSTRSKSSKRSSLSQGSKHGSSASGKPSRRSSMHSNSSKPTSRRSSLHNSSSKASKR